MGIAKRTWKASALAVAAAMLVSCGQTTPQVSDTEAFSNRPQNYDRLIAILKLETPALLSTATMTDGVPAVDPAAVEAINAEQDKVIADLQALSPEIKVLYRYRFVLNGISVVAPRELEDKFRAIAGVSYVERETPFSRLSPVVVNDTSSESEIDLEEFNSVSFIGALEARNTLTAPGPDGAPIALDGKGTTVGVIDTGIDYTHAMFGGEGTEDAFKNNDPNVIEEGSFPTARVVGGIDLVGTDFNSGSPNFDQHIPKPDNDPIDEGGHGTHVAGTVAGLGDGTNTYTGVAPGTLLHSIKVFGKNGSTGDAVILASLEYSADPNGDLDPTDRLDVINMSLGSGYGTPHILYGEAVENLAQGGVLVVASAGNSGHNSYIVGAPSTAESAISVAASIDGMQHNWKFPAVKFATPANPSILSEAIEGAITKPISEAGDINGKLVFIGLADEELTDEQKAALNGNIAFIDRGKVPFDMKVGRAQNAGAIGVVVANNVDTAPIVMGGEFEGEIPGIMITKALGDELKAGLEAGDVTIDFQTPERIEKPELIDTLTGFSSRGPRSVDALIKPEISAPGSNVISAKMGGGAEGVKFSGTSMAAPHMAGVMALMRQMHPKADVQTLKSLAVTTSTSIDDAEGELYPVAQQGAGRVQALAAVKAKIVASPATMSLGEVLVETGKAVRKSLTLTNVGADEISLNVKPEIDAGLELRGLPETITLAGGASQTLDFTVVIKPQFAENAAAVELDGFLKLVSETESHQIPILAVAKRAARISAKPIQIAASSPADRPGAASSMTLVNKGKTSGDALVFNLLGKDQRKKDIRVNKLRGNLCDLESAGWRVVTRDVEGETKQFLQIAAKLYAPVTTWHVCEISVQIDADGDDVADQELLGTYVETLSGNAQHAQLFGSALTDASKMRDLRREYELAFPEATDPDYLEAVLDFQGLTKYDHSTLAVVEADLSLLAKTPEGDLMIKVATQTESSMPEADDFLGKQDKKYKRISPTNAGMAFVGIPEVITVPAGEQTTIEFAAGNAKGKAIVYFPHNQSTLDLVRRDKQSKMAKVKYEF